ncbi:sucrose-6-phosphate hydrolase [Peribacillus sp. SCS-155]|uniref:sucrose-6-phosphate hydrolase n=1 Tax=Peribacillus sedimenti TaxID=3115297 RepID=UPI003905F122
MEWTKEQRYRKIEDVTEEELQNLANLVNQCPWRQSYHISPVTGLLNDPNGFSFFNGEYHLFYQWFPLGPVHGLKYWYHTKSKDLVHWENVGIALHPTNQYDSHGVYSGSALEKDGVLYLMYTGNTRDENWTRHPFQCIALMDEKGNIVKNAQPVISEVPEGYTDHFRDPKVWEENGVYYAIIGAQRTNKTGCTVLYKSADLMNWIFLGEMETGLTEFGYMWECPDYFVLDGQSILLFSPQGISPVNDEFQNIYQSGYVMGKADIPAGKLVHGKFTELDRGFDFYAPQTMVDPEGRRFLVGWMGLPDIDYPTDINGWAHCLTLVRELSIRNGKLIQKPVRETADLRGNQTDGQADLENSSITLNEFEGQTYELHAEFTGSTAQQFGLELRVGTGEKTVIKYDRMDKKVILDRTHSGVPVAEGYGSIRKCALDSEKVTFQVFVDVSSVEVFVNDGEEVFTGRIFPKADSRGIRFFSKGGHTRVKATKWDIKK